MIIATIMIITHNYYFQKACLYYLEKKSSFSEKIILEKLQLPAALCGDLILHAYGKEIKCAYILNTANTDFLIEILPHIKYFKLQNNDIILNYGDIVQDIVFVKAGGIQLTMNRQYLNKIKEVIIGKISPGYYFGDLEYSRSSLALVNYRSQGISSCFSVEFEKLKIALAKNTAYAEDFENECSRRHTAFLKAISSDIVVLNSGQLSCTYQFQDGILFDFQFLSEKLPTKELYHFMTLKLDHSHKKVISEENALDLYDRWIIYPNSQYKAIWDVFVGILVIATVLSTTSVLSFDAQVSFSFRLVDWIIDGFFFIDIILLFRTAYFDDEYLVTVPYMIAWRYFKTWFWLDFVSSIPFDDLLSASTSTELYSLSLLKIIRTFRIFRLFKLNRLVALARWIEDHLSINPVVFDIFKFMSYIMLIAHLVSCMWWAIPDLIDNNNSWHTSYGFTTVVDKYTASLYWTVATMTTIGYGDIVPVNAAERLIACGVMVLAAATFGYVVGNMSALILNMDPSSARKLEDMEEVSE